MTTTTVPYEHTEQLANGWKLCLYESRATRPSTACHWGKPTGFDGHGYDVIAPDGHVAGSRAFRVDALDLAGSRP